MVRKKTSKTTAKKAPAKKASSGVSKTTRKTTAKSKVDEEGKLKANEIAKNKKKAAVLDELERNNFHITNACKKIGIERKTFYNWLEADQDFAEKYLSIQEQDLDNSELTLRRLRDGVPKLDEDGNFLGWEIRPDVLAVMFHLKTKGKGRGYIERQEITGKDGSSLDVKVQVVGANDEDLNL